MKNTGFNMILLQEIIDNKNRLYLLCAIVILMLISWTGILDYAPNKYLDSSLTSATVSYVLSRSLNAAVSVMQTAEVSVVFASVQIGQMLDPINDMVERFSDLMVIAIASIITQEILLTIISSMFFKVLLTLSGLILIVSIYFKKASYINVLSRIFIFLLFLRLALSLMVLLNLTVDELFLDERIKRHQSQVQGLEYELDKINEINEKKGDEVGSDSINAVLKSEINDSLQQKEILINKRETQTKELLELQENLNDIKESIGQLESNLSLVDRYNPFHQYDDLEVMDNNLSKAEVLVTDKESDLERIDKNLENIHNSIIYNRNVIAGESNGVVDIIGSYISDVSESVSDKLSSSNSYSSVGVLEIKEKFDEKIESLVNLLVLYVMNTLVLPILFMYLLLKAFKLIWAIDLSELIKREFKTLESTNPHVRTDV